MQPTNTELVHACLGGEEAAWRTLIERYEALIYSIPLRYHMPPADADDIFQTVCMALLGHLRSLQDPERLAAWLVTTTRRECWARWRADARQQQLMSNNLVGENQDDPEELVSLYEERRRVLTALDQLPQRCQLLLRRLYLDAEPATYTQLAEELRMPVNSVGPTRGRCIERLLELLEENASVKVLSKPNSTLVS